MKINSINKERIEDIYLHDSVYSGYTYKNSFLDRGITYIALRIEINSGDTLLIICECIDYNVV